MASIGSLEVSLAMNASSFNGTVAQVNRNMKAMSSELQALKAKGSDYEKSIGGMSQKQDILARSFDAAGIKLQEQRRRYDELVASGTATEAQIERQANAVNQAQAQYNRLERELAEVTEQLRIQSSQWTQAGQRMQEVGSKLTAVGNSMKNIGKNMSMYVTAPLAAMSAGIVKIGMDFDSQMSKVSAVSGATGADFDALRTKAQDLGASTKFTATQVAEGMEYLALAGYDTNQILSATGGVLNLAAAGALDLGNASDILTDVMSAFGMKASESAHAADVFAYAQANANTNVEQMGEAMKYVAPMANQMGWSLEETSAAMMKLADNGLKGSIAGQAFASSLGRLAKPTKAMRGTMDELGLSFFDANDNMKSLPEIVGHLEDKFDGLTMKQKSAAITTLFGAEAYKHWAILLESGSDTLAQYTKELEGSDGTAQRMADTMNDNLAGSVLMLKSALEGLAIQFSDLIKDDLRVFAEWLTKMTGKFSELSDSTKKTILVVGALAAAIGPLIVAAGVMLSSIGTIISSFGAVALAIGEAGGVVALLSSKLAFLGPVFTALTGPIGLTIAAITAVGAGLVIAYQKVEWFRDGVQEIWEKIKNLTSSAFSVVSNFIKEQINDAVTFAKGIMDKFKAFWDENGKAIVGIVQLYFGQIKANIEAIMSVIKGVFEMVWPIISSVVEIAWNTIKLTIGNTLDAVLGVIQTVLKLIQGDWEGAWETIKTTAQNIIDNIKQYFENVNLVEIGKNIIQGFIDGFGSMVEGVKTSASFIMDQIKEKFGEKFEELKTNIIDWFTSMPGVIESKLTEWGTAISNWFTSLPANTAASLEEWWTAISDWFTSVPSKISAKLIEWATAIKNWTKEQNEENKRQFGEWWNAISEWFTSIPEKITSKLGDWGTAIKDWFTTIPDEIATKLSDWWNAISDWFAEAYEGITSKLSEWGESIGYWFTEMPSNIGDWLSDWWEKISTWFSEIPEKISTKLEEWWKSIKDWFDGVPDKAEIKDMGKKMIDKVAEGNTEKKPELLDKLGKIIVDVALGALAAAGVALIATGREIIKRLIDGIQEMKANVGAKAGEIKDDIIKKIKETNLLQVGRDIVTGLIKGMGEKITDVGKKAAELGNKVITSVSNVLQRKSPSRVMIAIGKDVGEGLALGIEDKKERVGNAMVDVAKGLIDITKKYSDEEKKFIEKSNADIAKIEKRLGEDISKIKRAAAEDNRKTSQDENIKIQRLQEDAAKKIADIEKKTSKQTSDSLAKVQKEQLAQIKLFVDDKKSVEEMSLAEEAEIWKMATTQFAAGTKERVEAQKNYNKAIETINKEDLESIKQYIADKKSLEELSLTEEAAIWERTTILFEEGTKERVEAQKAYQTAVQAINKELTATNKEYSDQIIKINEDLIKSEEALNKAYEDAVSKRESSLVNFKGTFDEFRVEIDKTGEELMANLQSQVSGFEEWQRQIDLISNKAIDKGLLDELRQMGPNALPQLMALNSMTDKQLTEYSDLYAKKSKLAREQAEKELEGMKNDTEKQIKKMRNLANAELDDLRYEWGDKIKAITKATGQEFSTLEQIGRDAGQGLLNGLSSMEGSLQAKAQSIANSIKSAIQSALDIHSPSRVMRGFGVNVGQGLVLGMDDMVGKVAGAAQRLASSVEGNITGGSSSSSINKSRTYNGGETHIHVYGEKPSPSEIARRNTQAQRQQAMEWGMT